MWNDFRVDELGRGYVLNGGYEALKKAGVWARPNVYTDSSGGLDAEVVQRYVDDFGCERLVFGSDYPFSTPARSLEVIHAVKMTDADREHVLSRSFMQFIAAPRGAR